MFTDGHSDRYMKLDLINSRRARKNLECTLDGTNLDTKSLDSKYLEFSNT